MERDEEGKGGIKALLCIEIPCNPPQPFIPMPIFCKKATDLDMLHISLYHWKAILINECLHQGYALEGEEGGEGRRRRREQVPGSSGCGHHTL